MSGLISIVCNVRTSPVTFHIHYDFVMSQYLNKTYLRIAKCSLPRVRHSIDVYLTLGELISYILKMASGVSLATPLYNKRLIGRLMSFLRQKLKFLTTSDKKLSILYYASLMFEFNLYFQDLISKNQFLQLESIFPIPHWILSSAIK